jgi:hypothetical protein
VKANIKSLQLGESIIVEVVEVLSSEVCIVSCNGDLVRVRNESHLNLRPGQNIQARVTQLKPLQFQILSNRSGSIDIVG